MSMADLVIIIIVVLMALLGLWKGFFKTLFSFCGWFVAMLVAVLTARVVAEALLDVNAIGNFVAGTGEGTFSLFTMFKGILPAELLSLPAGASESAISAALGDGIVSSLLTPFISLLTGTDIMQSSATVGEGIALALAGGVWEVIIGIAMFIVIRIIMALLVMFLKSRLDPDAKQGVLGRLGGFLFGAVRGVLFCAVLFAVIGFLTPFGFMQPVTNEIDGGVLYKPIAQQVYTLSGKITSNENYYNKLLMLTGLKGGTVEPPEVNDNEEKVKKFLDEALIDNGGLFNKQLTGPEKDFDVWIKGISDSFSNASGRISAGAMSNRKSDIDNLAALMTGGDAETAGDIYKAFKILAYDLETYQITGSYSVYDDIMTDFANIDYLLEQSKYYEMFGPCGFSGNTADVDLSRLESAYIPDEEPTPEPTPEPEQPAPDEGTEDDGVEDGGTEGTEE